MSAATSAFLLLVLCYLGTSTSQDVLDEEPAKPSGEKPGQCKKMPPGKMLFRCLNTTALCENDWDCTGCKKCCKYGCRKQCMEPAEKPGSCPVPNTRCETPLPPGECTTDSQCDGTMKCCVPVCTPTCVEPEKSGGYQ